jgi:lysosomal acid lipase/cholesteryl ester hydrolase
MGQFDYPAVFDYILSQTNSTSLNFIGHSQGTTSLLVCLSVRPEYNQKINKAHIFAPSAYRKKVPKSLIVYSFLRFLVSESEIVFNESKIMLMNLNICFSLLPRASRK